MNRMVLMGLASATLASGCASMVGASTVITNDKLVERTAFALGLDAAGITILDRHDEGVMSRYRARTAAGKDYNCSISGIRAPMMASVTDATCNEVGKAPGNPPLR